LIDAARRAHLDPLASAVHSVVQRSAAGCRAIDVRVLGGIDLRVLPDRGLDVGGAWFRGIPIAWISEHGECAPLPVEEQTPRRWGDCWGGGLVTTCGLCNVGEPSEGHGLHGTFTARAASEVKTEPSEADVTVTGVVSDPPFRLSRRIVTSVGSGAVRSTPVTRANGLAAALMLYHVNPGARCGTTQLDRDGRKRRGATRRRRGSRRRALDEAPALPEGAELIFEHGATCASRAHARSSS
jgi:hypothetical protein